MAPGMTAAEVLRAAKDRIDKPWKWHRGWSISDNGRHICALTALKYTESGQDGHDLMPITDAGKAALYLLADQTGINRLWPPASRLSYFNDGARHAEVMALFDRAIAAAESEASPA